MKDEPTLCKSCCKITKIIISDGTEFLPGTRLKCKKGSELCENCGELKCSPYRIRHRD